MKTLSTIVAFIKGMIFATSICLNVVFGLGFYGLFKRDEESSKKSRYDSNVNYYGPYWHKN